MTNVFLHAYILNIIARDAKSYFFLRSSTYLEFVELRKLKR